MNIKKLTQLTAHYTFKQLLNFSLCLFFLSLFFSIFFNAYAGQLDTLGDGTHYMSMYYGDLAKSPFGYRMLTPYIAKLLPWEAIISFKIITFFSLGLTSALLGIYSNKIKLPLIFTIALIFFWFFSYPFIYNSTTVVRVDPPMLLLISVIILESKYRVSYIFHLFFICLGVLFHEMILIVIPALWFDKIFKGNLTGGLTYKYWSLILITIISLAFFLFTRNYLEVLPSHGMSYIDTPFEMIKFVLTKSGGVIMHILRIYSSFGPILIFSIFFVFFQKKTFESLPFWLVLMLVIAATFFAVDTLRVMSIIYLPILLYSVQFLHSIWNSGFKYLALSGFGLQILFSIVVYLNFASFESSISLNLIAALFSLASLIICCFISYRNYFKNV